jgi:hypothetical protein
LVFYRYNYIMLSASVNNLISDLKPRQQEILSGRFGLKDAKKKTLASLGQKYGVTRERIRQIEEEAIKAVRLRIAEEKTIKEILGSIVNHLENLGGLRRDDLLVQEIRVLLKDNNLHHWHLRFLSEILGQPVYYLTDSDFHNFWYLDKKFIPIVSRFISKLEKLVLDKKDDLVIHQKFDDYFIKAAKVYNIPDFIGVNYLSVSQKFGINPFGDWGLNHWEEISPKTVRDKSYLVLKKHKEPLHFREISRAINEANFVGRVAHPQTVHNELIKDPRFVLVGRGIYGLSEQGFTPGFAREIIFKVLKQEGPLSLEEIIDSVLKQRFLKRNTIFLNLQNKKHFKKLSDGRYALR